MVKTETAIPADLAAIVERLALSACHLSGVHRWRSYETAKEIISENCFGDVAVYAAAVRYFCKLTGQ